MSLLLKTSLVECTGLPRVGKTQIKAPHGVRQAVGCERAATDTESSPVTALARHCPGFPLHPLVRDSHALLGLILCASAGRWSARERKNMGGACGEREGRDEAMVHVFAESEHCHSSFSVPSHRWQVYLCAHCCDTSPSGLSLPPIRRVGRTWMRVQFQWYLSLPPIPWNRKSSSSAHGMRKF